ncbi:MAG: hypothetical protein E6Q97_34125 [Desulfurellales bacterium]|nr:MAG: hypothetical protein E6Q97_34125 [Desulfurellales bacterium]
MLRRLALALGIFNFNAWLETADPKELAGWEAFGELEPFGELAHDLRTGNLLTALDRFVAGENSKASPEKFIMRYQGKGKRGKGVKVQSADEQLVAFRSIMDSHAAFCRG